MIIQIDSREKPKAVKNIIKYFDDNGIKHISSKLFVADYMNLSNPFVVVDRKQNLFELCQNVCQQHKRFTDELERARECGIHVIILCEHSKGITCLEDVKKWKNPRLKEHPLAVSGERLYKILSTMQTSDKYSVEFLFCSKAETGERIVKLLGGEPLEHSGND